MDPSKLEKDYENLIQESLSKGVVEIRRDGPEMRDAPRFHVEEERVSVTIQPKFEILNVSASGMAFQSDTPFLPGQVMTLFFQDALGIQARILACEMMESDPTFLEMSYRIQCRFENPDHGKQVLIVMRETGRLPS